MPEVPRLRPEKADAAFKILCTRCDFRLSDSGSRMGPLDNRPSRGQCVHPPSRHPDARCLRVDPQPVVNTLYSTRAPK